MNSFQPGGLCGSMTVWKSCRRQCGCSASESQETGVLTSQDGDSASFICVIQVWSTGVDEMNETSLSLLQQLRQSPETEAWERLHRIYQPLMRKWLIRYDLQASDADDVAQDALLAVAKDIDSFDHNGRSGAFRAWLKGILVNRLRKFWRSGARRPKAAGGSEMNRRLNELDDPASQMTLIWNKEHDEHVLKELLVIVEPQFSASTWAAFRKTTFEGVKPKVAAAELGMSLNAVVIAKSRVLNRLRQEAEGLIEASSKFLQEA